MVLGLQLKPSDKRSINAGSKPKNFIEKCPIGGQWVAGSTLRFDPAYGLKTFYEDTNHLPVMLLYVIFIPMFIFHH